MIDLAGMKFLWPDLLWLLVLVPGMIALYWRLLARRKRTVLSYAGLAPTAQPGGARSRFQRHAPPALLLLGLSTLLLAVARPHAVIMVPARQEAVILAMDVSGSMRATDIKPNRLAAAQEAAKAFVAQQPRHVKVGVVAIAGAAAVVQSPTDNRGDITNAIERFQLQRGSALGSGLIISLATLLPDAGIDVEQIVHGRSARWWNAPKDQPKPVPPGSNTSVAIILLSDGQSNVGPDPVDVAKIAAEHGVRIFPVGIGTTEGTTLGFEGWSMRVRLDEEALKKIATITRGEYFQARNADDLSKIYGYLTARLALDRQRSTEVTALFAAIGVALASLGALLSVFRYNRIL